MATFSNMISVFLCLVFFVSTGSRASYADDVETKLTEYINLFSLDLFKTVSHDSDHAGNNLIMSAMSTDIELAMLSLGADGETHDEINKGLYLPNSGFTKGAYKPAIDKMNDYKHITVNLTNKVYVQVGKNNALDPLYKVYVTHLFGSEVEIIDFTQSKAAAAKINSWIEDMTNHTVKDIVNPKDLDKETAIVLINTISFQGKWEKKFNPHYTVKDVFYTSADKEIQVDMMFQQNNFKYVESSKLDAKMLELNFEGNEMSMVFILPNEIDGLAALEDTLTKDYGKLKNMYDSLQTKFVTMYLPKFKIETTIHLEAALSNLGMSTMFSKKADFSDLLVNDIPFKVDIVTQKAYIDINEQGVSAADSIILMIDHVSKNHDNLFFADHPFCYGLVNSDGQIVLSGHFTGKQ